MSGNLNTQPRKASVLDNYRKTVTIAFRQDCENFFKRFEKLKSFSYDSFAATWHMTDFTYIYADMVKIRIVMDEYKALIKLLEIMKLQRYNDPLYCFVKLKADNAFLFVAHQKYLKLENQKLTGDCITFEGLHMKDTEGSLNKFQELIDDPAIKDLGTTCKEYEEKMKKYAEKCPSLAPFQTTIVSEFTKTYDNVINIDPNKLNPPRAVKPSEMSLHKKRQRIKKRAMKNKKAVYRGSKKVLTKINLEEELLFGKMELKNTESDLSSSE